MMRIVAALLAFACACPAADQWVRITTPDFEMYTTAGEKRGREAILYFERVRSFFRAISASKRASTFPVRIIAFRNQKEFEPFSPGGSVAAYYTGSQTRDYIVMRDLESSSYPVAIHEYFHLIAKHSGMELPVWLNEGWADVYSTLKSVGNKTMVGDMIPGRVQSLQVEKWLDFDTLTSVKHDSPQYTESTRMGIFYGESWALVHMLLLSPEYAPGFGKFLQAVTSGSSAAAACQSAYGKSADQVFKDLRSYLSRNRLFGQVFDEKLEKAAVEAVATPVSDLDAGLTTGDLFAAINRAPQASGVYSKLAEKYPDSADVSRSMGYLAWQTGDRGKAREYFEKAFGAGEKDPQMCFHLGMLQREANGSSDSVVKPLLRALEAKPDYMDARFELGYWYLRVRNFEGALSALTQIKSVPPERAASLFNAIAYARLERNEPEDARNNVELALKWAKTDADRSRANDLLRFLNLRAEEEKRIAANQAAGFAAAAAASKAAAEAVSLLPPGSPNTEPLGNPFGSGNPFVRSDQTVERVEGTAKSLDCNGNGAILRIQAANGVVSLNMPEPDRVLLKHNGAETFEFTCGPQKAFHVAAEYVPEADAKKGTIGTLRLLEF